MQFPSHQIFQKAVVEELKKIKRFLEIAISSSFELETQLLICIDLNYIKANEINLLMKNLTKVQRLIYGLIHSLKKEI